MRRYAALAVVMMAPFLSGFVPSAQHHTSCGVDWKYDPTGELQDVRDLVDDAAREWSSASGANTGLKFWEDVTNARFFWFWDKNPGAFANGEWAKTHLRWDAITDEILGCSTGLNPTPKTLAGTPLEWSFDPNAGDLGTDSVDAYSVILHEFGHWYRLNHSDHQCAVMYAGLGVAKKIQDLRNDDAQGGRYMSLLKNRGRTVFQQSFSDGQVTATNSC